MRNAMIGKVIPQWSGRRCCRRSCTAGDMVIMMRTYLLLCAVGLTSTIIVGVFVYQRSNTNYPTMKNFGRRKLEETNMELNPKLERKLQELLHKGTAAHPSKNKAHQFPDDKNVFSDSIPNSELEDKKAVHISKQNTHAIQKSHQDLQLNENVYELPQENKNDFELALGDVFKKMNEDRFVPGEETINVAPLNDFVAEEETNLANIAQKHKTTAVKTVNRMSGMVKSCSLVQNIAMIKTHKCSSSTLQNIIYRYGDDHNLDIVLPRDGVYLGSPNPFNRYHAFDYVPGKKYNILANHLKYQEGEIAAVMNENSIYITILRNPATQFESMYTYYRYQDRFRASLSMFLMHGESTFRINEPRLARQVGRNPMSFDVGLDARFLEANSFAVKQYIQGMDEKFDLVLIAEYFDESLILLKDILCWSLEDMVYFTQNARSKSSVKNVSASQQGAIYRWNAVDTLMYNHFNKTLWEKIDAFGRERMALEVTELKRKNAYLQTLCIGKTMNSGDQRMWYPEGIKVKSFVLNPQAEGNHLCDQMTRPELTYIEKLKEKVKSTRGQVKYRVNIHNLRH